MYLFTVCLWQDGKGGCFPRRLRGRGVRLRGEDTASRAVPLLHVVEVGFDYDFARLCACYRQHQLTFVGHSFVPDLSWLTNTGLQPKANKRGGGRVHQADDFMNSSLLFFFLVL